MKNIKLSLFLLCLGLGFTTAHAQISKNQLKPFIPKGYTLEGTSGDGLKKPSGDILLILASKEMDDFETLVLLNNVKGKLSKIVENSSLLMSENILGTSGGNYPSLSGTVLSVNYSIGSGSAFSDVSIQFQKNKNGQYEFKEYRSSTKNYGVENLFAREKITAEQIGKVRFTDATEDLILKKANTQSTSIDIDEWRSKGLKKYANYIFEDYQFVAFADGDLNLDSYKKDAVLISYNDGNCVVQLLLQQKDGSYKMALDNFSLIKIDDRQYNANNLKAVIKNGYFTIEQRIVVDNQDNFDHRYITFKYDATQKNWLLHRFDVEHYEGFNTKPSKDVTHLTTKDFGKITFQKIQNLPGIYYYEPEISIVSGTLTKKMFYGRPNYGETPEIDEKFWVYILKPNYPANVYGDIDPIDPETSNKTMDNVTEIQVYSTDRKIDFKNYENKKIKLQGVFQYSQTGHHYTKVLMEVKKIL
ncbi:MAG TPA: DUF4431 domain-containing protein [Edaphocola sp.]|nr:DUF4431 domain-containing protein [Edaphocola sp.]